MVTKRYRVNETDNNRSVLAKIHMVTKRFMEQKEITIGSVLAKIHMVTKLSSVNGL